MKTPMKFTAALFALLITAAPLAADITINVDADAPDHSSREKEKAVEKEADLYDEGTDALDEHDWRTAATIFRKVAAMTMSHADASLYWLAYAQNKMGQRSEALATLNEFQTVYPHSRWKEDGKALEVEIRQASGQQISPDHVADDDVKLMALNGLMGSDPERALPIIERLLSSTNNSKKVKERALFVLTQSGSPRAYEIVAKVAKGDAHPDLQTPAVRYLGIMGGEQSRKLLAEVYTSSNDIKVKKTVLKSYMVAGDRAHLLSLAKGEQVAELRGDAITQLGVLGARNELAELYATEPVVEIRKKIIQAMFIGGNAEKLSEIARGEKVLELRVAAIKNLGLLGGARTGPLLIQMYETDPNPEVRRAVIKSLFLQQNAKALIDLARKEKDPELKKDMVKMISLMRSKEATDFLLEFLKD
jgi:HEAT repeat protein